MKIQWKKLAALAAATAMLLSMSACSGEDNPDVANPDLAPGEATGAATAPDGTVVTDPTTPVDDSAPVSDNANIITGLEDMGDSDLTRPVGIMVANNDFIQDEQVGISKADMWVETETEGGITRLMAVYANTERVPESIGPIRSARSPFVHIVKALGLAYCHAGGSYTALAMIDNTVADLDVNSGAYSWRDTSYPHAYEYQLRTSGEELTQYVADEGYKTYAVTDFPWTFGDQSGTDATDISIKMSSMQTIGFEYADGVYYKTNGSSKTRHTDNSGTIAAESVLVMYTDKVMENDLTHDYTLGSGKGYVFSDGKMRRFNWSRDDNGFTMTEEDGTQLTLAKGKVYMCVVSTDYADGISY